MLCSNCGKRPAVVFIADSSGNNQKGYCLSCADKLNINKDKGWRTIIREAIDQVSDKSLKIVKRYSNEEDKQNP